MSLLEYMVLPDDTVMVFPETRSTMDIKDCLSKYGGIAYYWRNKNMQGVFWVCVYPGDDKESEPHVELPEMVKLAVMLE